MRQGFAVTILLLVVGVPTMYFSDGGWAGVQRDFGHAVAFRPFAPAALASSARPARSNDAMPSVIAETREAVVDDTVVAAVSVARGAAGMALSRNANVSPFLVAPNDPYFLNGGSGLGADADADITGGIADSASVARSATADATSLVAPENYGAAFTRYQLALDPGNADLRYAIAEDYLSGAVPDYTQGARWLLSAAGLGNSSAALALSGLYINGDGVEQNYVQADFWANIALRGLVAPADIATARDRIDRLTRSMTDDQRAASAQMLGAWSPPPVSAPALDSAAADPVEPTGAAG